MNDLKTISYEIKDYKIAVITLNRPSNFNAINLDLAQEFMSVLQKAKCDDNVRVLIITGSGKGFCAGGDLASLMEANDNPKKREILDSVSSVISSLDKFDKPVIASVNGAVAGSGTAVVLACDIIIASDKAKFAPNFINIAAVPDGGSSWFLTRKISYHRAAELILTGRILNARECFEWGIFNHIVTPERLNEEVFNLAQKLSTGPQRALRYIKQMLKMSAQNTLCTHQEVEASLQLLAFSDDDFQEGVSAFLQKRKPNFK